jgi:8-oxo-dGTP pyrophosphatase MutT (NUDIX family)
MHSGLLNGIGGKLEDGEDSFDAATREFAEETGIPIDDTVTMRKFGNIGDLACNWDVDCFYAIVDFNDDFKRDIEEGSIAAYDLSDVHYWYAVQNISWLVPMALEAATNNNFVQGRAFYNV